jgi:hypothetical protein
MDELLRQLYRGTSEITAARQCLAAARRVILERWPIDEQNNWADTPPPPEVVEAMGLFEAAAGHLANLQERD